VVSQFKKGDDVRALATSNLTEVGKELPRYSKDQIGTIDTVGIHSLTVCWNYGQTWHTNPAKITKIVADTKEPNRTSMLGSQSTQMDDLGIAQPVPDARDTCEVSTAQTAAQVKSTEPQRPTEAYNARCNMTMTNAHIDRSMGSSPAGGDSQNPRACTTIQGPGGNDLEVIAFYWPGKEAPCDVVCRAGFLANFYDVSPAQITVTAITQLGKVVKHLFPNAESAFQALKFWDRADEFTGLSGDESFRKKSSLRGTEDRSYGGFGSNWAGMWHVLKGKFSPGSDMAKRLLMTGDMYLLEHNSKRDRDKLWSDNQDGEGQNWLGLQLMLLRDELRGGSSTWSTRIQNYGIDLSVGPSWKKGNDQWQAIVMQAATAVNALFSAQQQQIFDDWRKTIPPVLERVSCILNHAAIGSDGTITISKSNWDSEDNAAINQLIAEYEQLMGAARLCNTATGQPGLGQFKKLPVFGRVAKYQYEKRVNDLRSSRRENSTIAEYLHSLKDYHQSFQGDVFRCTDDAHISQDQLKQLYRIDFAVAFPLGYSPLH